MNSLPLVKFENVSVVYKVGRGLFNKKTFTPLSDLSFDLFAGETLGIVGRNGAGKSTILKLIAGIVDADSGSITNRSYSSMILSIQLGFKQGLSGRDNIIQSGLLFGLSLVDISAVMPKVIEFAGLGEHIDRPLSGYSMGMRARLGFAIAIQANAEILLIDELLAVGDSEFRAKSGTYIRERVKSDQTVVIVSHDMSTLTEICNRLLWIENGETRMIGETEAVMKAYMDYKPDAP
jgi:lipopolysaccharide transport system ATP-binding protein